MLLLMPLLAWSLSFHARLPPRTIPVLDSPTRHVRATDARLRRLLKEGYGRSPTLASLVDHLEASDLFVYVETAPRLPHAIDARLEMIPSAASVRYVRIQITTDHSPYETIALLGHELRHAVEVADARGVVDNAGMEELYASIGTEWGAHAYETKSALDAARHVRRELLGG
jgi:hypothetical protein